jgi:phosphohistidine swiveling domain-containing protein
MDSTTSGDIKSTFLNSIEKGKEQHIIAKRINLPPVITSDQDVDCFSLPQFQPNFITDKCVSAEVIAVKDSSKLEGKIALISNADPGFDWIFTHNIKGLVTEYGGLNSHMAIRASELDIPAVIGVGEILFKKFSKSRNALIDCANKRIDFLSLKHS